MSLTDMFPRRVRQRRRSLQPARGSGYGADPAAVRWLRRLGRHLELAGAVNCVGPRRGRLRASRRSSIRRAASSEPSTSRPGIASPPETVSFVSTTPRPAPTSASSMQNWQSSWAAAPVSRPERDGATSVVFPQDLEASFADGARVVAGESRLFEARLRSRNDQLAQLRERAGQYKSEIAGLKAQEEAKPSK